MLLDLPTTETVQSSGEKKKALPGGSYQAKLAYFYFDQALHMGTPYAYQDVGFRWLIVPGEVLEKDTPDEQGMTIADGLDDAGFYPYTDKFNELLLKAEWLNPTTKKIIKASPFIRRMNALAANFGTSFSDKDGKNIEYVVDDEKFEKLGEFPVYQNISRQEAQAFEKANGAEAAGTDQFKDTGRKQSIYKGVVKDIKVNGFGTVGGWVSLELGVNAKGYNTAGANAVRPLNHLERLGLKGAGYDLPTAAPAQTASVGGAPQ